ncbi:hypothetical protein WMY93_029328 [Mugilogobius chulae]|uniref:AIG1-type G domain-containing protein n=1 Tax=Mugilogobius chulae TaxID=88201 RepID=A0AAW0MV34_9GOBI
MAEYTGQSEPGQVVVLLLGPRQSGKSSVGNVILGRRAFGDNTAFSSRAGGVTVGKQVTVVDTPGWLPIVPSSERVPQELQRALFLCGPGPDVVLLVLSVLSRLGPIQWDALENQLRRLRLDVWDRTIVLFTHTDCLGNFNLQEHIRREGRALQRVLDRCGNRYHVLRGYHSDRTTAQSEVQQLFVKMQRIITATATAAPGRPAQEECVSRGVDRRQQQQRSMMGNQEQIEMRLWPNLPNSVVFVNEGADLGLRQSQWRPAASWQLSRVYSSRRSMSNSPLSIVLLGRRKSGKSSVGNFLLGSRKFKMDSETSRSAAGQGVVSGTSVTVVDTPGWSLFEKDRAKVEKYLSVLGADVWRKMLVLFTFGDELRGKSIQEHVTKQGQSLQWLMQRCGYRHHVIETSLTDDYQLEQLMDKIKNMAQ